MKNIVKNLTKAFLLYSSLICDHFRLFASKHVHTNFKPASYQIHENSPYLYMNDATLLTRKIVHILEYLPGLL